MRPIAFAAMLLMWGSALPTTVYKWVDKDGVTHYSDQPHPGAVKFEVGTVQTYSAPAPGPTAPVSRGPKQPEAPIYAACELYQPTNDQVYFNVSTVTAKLRLDPPLRAGDKALIALDGKRLVDAPFVGNEFTMTPVYRGTHTLMAVVEDLAGNAVCQTPIVTFHVRQASRFSPQSPTRPKTSALPPARP